MSLMSLSSKPRKDCNKDETWNQGYFKAKQSPFLNISIYMRVDDFSPSCTIGSNVLTKVALLNVTSDNPTKCISIANVHFGSKRMRQKEYFIFCSLQLCSTIHLPINIC